jgi:carbamoyltransferase
MIILGLHCGHNSSAALMRDGKIIGAVQEERFTKRKNQVAFPVRAIRDLVDCHLGGEAGHIDKVVFASRKADPIGLAVARYSDFDVADHVKENHEYWRRVFYEGNPNDGNYWRDMFWRGEHLNRDHNADVEKLMSMPLVEAVPYLNSIERPAVMRRVFGWEGPFEQIDHHSCHAYYAFYGAPVARERWHDVLILTADSWGDDCNWSAWTVDPDGVLSKRASGADHGVARIYRFVTLILGMKPNEHEYKAMGLSSYSKSKRHIAATERVFFEALDFRDGKFVTERPLKECYFDLKDRLEGHRFDNVAAALQNWTTAVTRAWAAHWLKNAGKRRLCFSGGLSMNIKMNGVLAEMPELDDLSVPASGGDETTPLGACFLAQKQAGGEVRPLAHVYLGAFNPRDRENDWEEGIRRADLPPGDFAVRDGVGIREIAKLLAEGHIIARCMGPMEFGARALGNRSILADPSNPDNIKRINDAIKNRDFWMPFTPSILAERAEEYLVIPKGIVSPYMTIGYQSTPRARRDIIAALHPGDFSARPQFVLRDTNPDYWALIKAFEKITGIGALLNTSLNLHGDPMNSTVADAARTLALSALEFLALPSERLLYRKSAEPVLAQFFGHATADSGRRSTANIRSAPARS